MAEGQGQGRLGAHTVIVESEICVTDAASGDLDQGFSLTGLGQV